MLRFAACDLGLPGGGVELEGRGIEAGGGGPVGFNRVSVGVTGSTGGARLERIRTGTFVTDSEPRSIADAERTGGPEAGDAREPLIPGEAVWALDGGGGGAGFGVSSDPACRLFSIACL